MTVRLAQDMGMPLITEYAKRFGIYDDLLPVLSMSLGAGETTLLRMATAYCMIANGGKAVRPTLIDRIQDRWGKSVWRHDARQCAGCTADAWAGSGGARDRRRPQADHRPPHRLSDDVDHGRRDPARHGHTSLKSLNRPLAGKTGTTNEEKDAWFIGYTPDLVVGVFVGYDTPQAHGQRQHRRPRCGADLRRVHEARSWPTRRPFRSASRPASSSCASTCTPACAPRPDDPQAIVEAFKPNEEPDDAYSVIGFSDPAHRPRLRRRPRPPSRRRRLAAPRRRADRASAPAAAASGRRLRARSGPTSADSCVTLRTAFTAVRTPLICDRVIPNIAFATREAAMRAEAQKLVSSIQEALVLLRRYL